MKPGNPSAFIIYIGTSRKLVGIMAAQGRREEALHLAQQALKADEELFTLGCPSRWKVAIASGINEIWSMPTRSSPSTDTQESQGRQQ